MRLWLRRFCFPRQQMTRGHGSASSGHTPHGRAQWRRPAPPPKIAQLRRPALEDGQRRAAFASNPSPASSAAQPARSAASTAFSPRQICAPHDVVACAVAVLFLRRPLKVLPWGAAGRRRLRPAPGSRLCARSRPPGHAHRGISGPWATATSGGISMLLRLHTAPRKWPDSGVRRCEIAMQRAHSARLRQAAGQSSRRVKAQTAAENREGIKEAASSYGGAACVSGRGGTATGTTRARCMALSTAAGRMIDVRSANSVGAAAGASSSSPLARPAACLLLPLRLWCVAEEAPSISSLVAAQRSIHHPASPKPDAARRAHAATLPRRTGALPV